MNGPVMKVWRQWLADEIVGRDVEAEYVRLGQDIGARFVGCRWGDDKPHYIGPPGVAKPRGPTQDGSFWPDIWQPADSPVGRIILSR